MKTCGPLYREIREQLIDRNDPVQVRAFAAGFAAGECEKVYLGACRACMFRPRNEATSWLLAYVTLIAKHYGLHVRLKTNPDPEMSTEIWVLRDDATLLFGQMDKTIVNSPLYHTLRARLCGIPENEIDPEFHKRDGTSGGGA